MTKKNFIVSVIFLFIFILLGCNSNRQIEEGTVINKYEGMTIIEELGMKNVFSDTRINISEYKYLFFNINDNFINFYDRIFVMDERVYIAAKKLVDKANLDNMAIILHSYDINGENVREVEIPPVIEGAIARFMWFDSEYNQIIIDELDYTYALHKRDQSDNIVFSVPLDVKNPNYIVSMAVGENDNIYIGTPDTIYVFSKNGEKICELILENELVQIISAHDKKPILKFYKKNMSSNATVEYLYINADTQKLEEIEMPVHSNYSVSRSYIIYGDGYDYYHMTIDGIYGYDIASNTLTQVLNWLNSDIAFSDIQALTVISPDKMAMISYDYSIYTDFFNMLNRIPDDKIPDKTYISIGYITQYEDMYFNLAVSTFNKYNDKYRITVKNYYSAYDGLDAALRLNNDIAAGNVPDLLYINNQIPVLNYINQNLLVDLNEYLENDKTLSDNLLPLVTAPMINNKLPQMITSFTIDTLAGKSKNIGNTEGWTYKDILEISKTIPAETEMMWGWYNGLLQYNWIDNIISECVDYANGTCNFDTQEFRDYLELYKSLPDSFNYNLPYEEVPYKCRDDEYYLCELYISSISSYYKGIIKSFRDEETTMIGYPTTDGIHRSDKIAAKGFSVLNSSKNKDAAWEFIKFCLSDEFSSYTTYDCITPTKTAVELRNDFYYELYEYIKDDDLLHPILSDHEFSENNKEEYGIGIEIYYDEELLEKYTSYLMSLDDYIYTDNNIKAILQEEMSDFYKTSKSIDDTINSIQNRVSIYLNETWN